jgi:ubiquitin C-terminal hydrolase
MNKEDWKTSLFKIRSILSSQNTIYEENNEINPRFFLSFLLGRLNKELNLKKGSYQNPFHSLFSGDMNSQQNSMNYVNFSKKEESFNFFLNYFNENNNSIISNYFYGNMKTKTVCSTCQLTTYSYQAFNFITFNLDLIQKYLIKNNYKDILNQINLFHCFIAQNETLVQINNFSRYCRQCKQNNIHTERKQFSTFPRYFVICLDRGADCENKTKIYYNNILDLSAKHDNPNSYNYFMIKGIIKRLDINNKEHYISIYYDFNKNSWIVRDDSNIQKINSPFDHNQGYEIMFFYEALVNNGMNNSGNNMNITNVQQNMNQNQNMLNSNMNITGLSNAMNNMNINSNINMQNMTGYANNNMNMNGNNMNMSGNNMNMGGNNKNMGGNNMNMGGNNMNMVGNNMNMGGNNMNMGGNNMNMNINNGIYSGMGSGMFNNNMNMNNMNFK